MEGSNNIITLFFSWWYGEAYSRIFKYLRAVFIFTADLFSVRICLKTLFDPWKRDKISYEGLTLKQKLEVLSLNGVSRFVGMLIKLITLLSFILFVVVFTIISMVFIFIWLIYPALIIFLLYKAIKP